jgi:hypothetical protein
MAKGHIRYCGLIRGEPSGSLNHQNGCVIFINTQSGGPQVLTHGVNCYNVSCKILHCGKITSLFRPRVVNKTTAAINIQVLIYCKCTAARIPVPTEGIHTREYLEQRNVICTMFVYARH